MKNRFSTFVTALPVAVSVLLSSCTVGPDYKRPQISVPAAFRAPEPLRESQAASFADLKWFNVFGDPRLQELIRTALVQNYDLRDAVARVEEARANLGLTRSNQIPQLGASGSFNVTRVSRGATTLPESIPLNQNLNYGSGGLNLLSFELDLWGRLRRSTEAARANLLSADDNRRTVVSALVSEVATSYLQLRALDLQLEISDNTLRNRWEFLHVTQQRQDGGVGTLLDVRQAEQLVETARAGIPALKQQIEQTENQISLLLGNNPGSVERGPGLTEQEMPEVPAGLPSSLLERRPDIRAAEEALIAVNANIGVAKAAYFPQVSLSGLVGGESSTLTKLFSGPNRAWSFVPQVSQPIFTAGRTGSTVRIAEAQRTEAVIAYEKTIQTAFSEVSNALIAHQRTREARDRQEQLVEALTDRKRLAYMRYEGGVDTQLNALDADRDLFSAQLRLAQDRLNELLSIVQLYRALGGGWQV